MGGRLCDLPAVEMTDTYVSLSYVFTTIWAELWRQQYREYASKWHLCVDVLVGPVHSKARPVWSSLNLCTARVSNSVLPANPERKTLIKTQFNSNTMPCFDKGECA